MTVGPLSSHNEKVVATAREWVGTPYLHQASLKGHGADCLGLIRGIWREILGPEPVLPPRYSRDWCEVSKNELLWRAAARWLQPASGNLVGHVLLFRMNDSSPAKHLAIRSEVGDCETIIHAYSGRSVIEMPFTNSWRRRFVAGFQFPEDI